jgi:hypothetical protein
VIQLLLHTLDGAAMFLNAVLQTVFLVAQGSEFLFELRTIAEKVHEFVCVLFDWLVNCPENIGEA